MVKDTSVCGYLINECEKAVLYLHEGDSHMMRNTWSACISMFDELYRSLNNTEGDKAEKIEELLVEVKKALENPLKCAYIIEKSVIPLLYSISNDKKESVIEGSFVLTMTESGFYSLADKDGFLITSPDNPLRDAVIKAKAYYKPNMQRFYLMGAELGYLAYALWKLSEESLKIHIFENNEKNIELAREYGVLSKIDPTCIEEVVKEDIHDLYSEFISTDEKTDDTGYYIGQSLLRLYDGNERNNLEGLISAQCTMRDYERKYAINRWKNKNSCQLDFYDDFFGFLDKTNKRSITEKCIIVAGGPSTLDNIDYLRDIKGKQYIISVSTALRTLLNNGIEPDLVVVIDPNPTLLKHIEGIEEKLVNIPLVAEALSFWKFNEKYPGIKFRALCSDSLLLKGEMDKRDIRPLYLGGTVTVFAAGIAKLIGAKEISLIGADFAYPGNKQHADSKSEDASAEKTVWGCDGNLIGTSNTLDEFRLNMETLIEDSEEVTFINLSKNGAYIHGTFCGRWWEKGIKELNEFTFIDSIKKEQMLDWSEKYYLMWQSIYNVLSDNRNITEDFWKEIGSLFENIEKDFVNQIEISQNGKSEEKSGLVVLLTSDFRPGEETLSDQILEDAEKIRHSAGKNVLIVNTGEYLGGKRVPIVERVERKYNQLLKDRNDIIYLGERYPYFQMPEDMPDGKVTEAFIGMLKNSVPELVISYDPFSLVAAACKHYFNVEHR